ncbi:unnamed protein product [Zymoseptoria tritici ST99CH_3D1]|nr:unnamed protein product [Zymoseptoria tritici ST99CH_3D1]
MQVSSSKVPNGTSSSLEAEILLRFFSYFSRSMKSFAAAAVAASIVGVASARQCQNLTVPVVITARNAVFDKEALTPKNNIDVTNIILTGTQQGHNATAEALKGYADVSGTYHIAATYCEPDSGTPTTIQILTHGIGFDRSYWDFSYNNYNYSYNARAVDEHGYATFAYDRLGIGQSSIGEPVNEIQVQLEIAALKSLTEDIRSGCIDGVPAFRKVLHVGHSFGSVQTYALTAMYPDISDGIVLTGFSQNGTFLPFFQLGGNFVQANLNSALSKYPDGYLAAGSPSGVQTNFFSPGDFDPLLLPVAFKTGQPVTVGELLTIGGAAGAVNQFRGPVLIITGERDVPFCGGDAYKAPTGFKSIPETSKAMFPATSKFEVQIVPGAGHGLNLEYTAPMTYSTIATFLAQNGLAPSSSMRTRRA